MNNESENNLILESARTLLKSADDAKFAKLLARYLDWDYLLETLNRHKLTPLFFWRLNESGLSDLIAANQFEKLRTIYLSSVLNNHKLYQHLSRVLALFAEKEIPVILLKGAALGINTYPDSALRPFGDLDIMVHKKDVRQGQKLLGDLGYQLVKNIYFPVPDERNDELGCEWTYHLDSTVVELHWSLIDKLNPFNVDIERFWNNVEPVNVNKQRALVLNPANQILHLCLHQSKHLWKHLRDLTDIGLIMENFAARIDWEKLYFDAKSQDLDLCIFYSISLAQKVLEISVPPDATDIMTKLNHSTFIGKGLEEMIAAHILEEHLPRRFWKLLTVKGAKNKVISATSALSHPLPRSQERTSISDIRKPVSFLGKVSAAFKSSFYYRKLFFEFPRYLVKSLSRKR